MFEFPVLRIRQVRWSGGPEAELWRHDRRRSEGELRRAEAGAGLYWLHVEQVRTCFDLRLSASVTATYVYIVLPGVLPSTSIIWYIANVLCLR